VKKICSSCLNAQHRTAAGAPGCDREDCGCAKCHPAAQEGAYLSGPGYMTTLQRQQYDDMISEMTVIQKRAYDESVKGLSPEERRIHDIGLLS
jgi:hypothetical protein